MDQLKVLLLSVGIRYIPGVTMTIGVSPLSTEEAEVVIEDSCLHFTLEFRVPVVDGVVNVPTSVLEAGREILITGVDDDEQ
jgi:hypothetical protein